MTVKMNAAVFDGVFSGTTNGMTAAMTGKLAFTGNTVKAIAMQRVQADIERLYGAARATAGGPGDLDIRPPSAAPAPPSAAEELAEAVAELVAAGLVTSTGGNVSVRLPEGRLLLTPSQIPKGTVTAAMMVQTDDRGEPLDPDAAAPTSERDLHAEILRRRPDLTAVVHSHAPHAITLGLAGLPFLPISTEAAFIGDLARVPFIMPGTPELAHAVADALGDSHAVLLENHGLVVAASSLRRAIDLTGIVEETAEKLVACAMIGATPPVLPDETLRSLRALGDLVA